MGAGPAGLALAAACAERSLPVVLVAPDPRAAWTATYGVWADEVDVPLRHRFERVRAVGTSAHDLGRAYGLVDNAALQAALLDRLPEGAVVDGRAVAVDHHDTSSTVALDDGRCLEATVVVVATGASRGLAEVRAGRPAWQVARGVVARCSSAPAPAGSCTLMDWTGPSGTDPTFLYAMDLGDGTWFLEETSLARRPALPLAAAAARLEARLARLGVELDEVLTAEDVVFPMGAPVPRPQRAVVFGAAGGLVHPATGYSVGASLRLAPTLAGAIDEGLSGRGGPAVAAALAWRALWPSSRRQVRLLEQWGLEALLRMDRRDIGAFFDAFFSVPSWPTYLQGSDSVAQTATLMRRVFAAAPSHVRRHLVAGRPWRAARAAGLA